jgi:hypothetical protein
MPDVSDVREIISSRVGRAVSPATPTQRPTPRSACCAPIVAYFSTWQRDVERYKPLYGDTFRHMRRGNSWRIVATKCCLLCGTPSLPSGSQPRTTKRNQAQPCPTVPRCCPVGALWGCLVATEPLSEWGPTNHHGNGPQKGSAGVRAGASSSGADTLTSGRIGDSERWGLTRCQRQTAPPLTCDRRNSPTSCTSPPAPCVGGDGKERARYSSGTVESCDTAAMRLTLGPGRVIDFRVLRMCRCGGPPWPGRTAASVEVRREHSPLSTRCYPTTLSLREVSVTPTLKPEPLLRATPPGARLNTSPLISVGPVIP